MKKRETIKPNLFIVGAPRAGTTSLYNYLKQHPEVFMSEPKNPRFFGEEGNLVNPHFHKNEKEYLKLFKNAKDKKVVGEASHYFMSITSPEEIKKFNPNSKIIIIIRNPVDLLISYLNNESLIERPVENFLDKRGNLQFSKNIERYLKVFGKNVYVIIFEEFFSNPKKEFTKLCSFLNIQRLDLEFKQHNPTRKRRNVWLQKFYLSFSSEKKQNLKEKLPKSVLNRLKKIYSSLSQGEKSKKEYSLETKKKIIHYFENEIKKTGKLLKKDLLSMWKIK